ncbi:carbohydrate ABC transporter substrate-binding protein, CUT1 family [Tistlia consotensis]|uniref:Carbohydrate ABC transporter substrate-binding protein, CUT1 family n=1 Tax=Tistlia consotensis USBA 355 TaxID=560819 RepID=A0A1Y6BEW2_9PROT|nr:ABC transporter substrate-binding protein [Tistlia consotensis]SMF00490.1 carbohydrate ABC transporter substrate-binding protein, CUT1 family [Tistlia consotensis USBA 355]SNR75796.1 carbohydrate ABC transporter substrate-binding protein, CUT1 family [Tistlia consotensis]
MRTGMLLAAAAALLVSTAAARAQTEIVIQYPYGELFNRTHAEIREAFEKTEAGKDIKVTFRPAYESYEDGTQKVLREAITGQTPDITFQGLNRLRILVDRDIAVPLKGFIEQEKDFEAAGFHQAMFDIGTMKGDVYGIPFAISLPIAYYNLDLVKRAGGDPAHLPTTWDEVFALSAKIDALGDDINGMSYAWNITGNWLFQAPVFSQGGTMMNADETRVAFDGPEGRWAITQIARMVTEGKMPDYREADLRATFAAGKTGIHFTSTSDLAKVTDMIGGKFALKTAAFPDVKPGVGRLPAGGNLAIVLTKDPAKQKAAWEVVKFWTGAEGAAVVARTTGYMPPNKKANEVYLKDFYQSHPNNYVAVSQLPLLTKWYAFPGENGLKITDVIKDHLQSIVNGSRANEPLEVLKEMSADVEKLLPRGS